MNDHGHTRRRFLLTRIVQAFSAVAGVMVAYPFARSLFPGGSEDLVRDVELTSLRPGEAIMIPWLGRRVLILRRTREQLAALDASATETLADPASENSRQPVNAVNVQRSLRPEYFVAFSNCTHLGCEVAVEHDTPGVAFTCPCHRSEFDSAGRVFRESAAELNLSVPSYRYISRNQIRLQRS